MRSNFQQPISKNLQCAVLQSWMLLICRQLHWLATAGSCHSLCDTSFVWQLQSFLFQHKKKKPNKNRVAVKTCLKGSSSPQQQTDRGERRRNTAQQLANMNVSIQEIVRGHLYFTTMISPFHLLLAALPLFFDCNVFYIQEIASFMLHNPANRLYSGKKEKDAHGERYVQKKKEKRKKKPQHQ